MEQLLTALPFMLQMTSHSEAEPRLIQKPSSSFETGNRQLAAGTSDFAAIIQNAHGSPWCSLHDKETAVVNSLLLLKFDTGNDSRGALDSTCKSGRRFSSKDTCMLESDLECNSFRTAIKHSRASCLNTSSTIAHALSSPEFESAKTSEIHGLLMPKKLLDIILEKRCGADTRRRKLPGPRRAVLLETPAVIRNGNQKFWVARAVVTLQCDGRTTDSQAAEIAFCRTEDCKRLRTAPESQSFIWKMTNVTKLKPAVYIPRQFGPVTWIKFTEEQLTAVMKALQKGKSSAIESSKEF